VLRALQTAGTAKQKEWGGNIMTTISIASCLWLEETELGATLNYRSESAPGGLLFRVGISHGSLQACNDAMVGSSCIWTIRDGSLTISGDSEELTLTFCSANEVYVQEGVSLYGEELIAFKAAINAFASRLQTALN
jgi:hypothetical protein